MATQTGTILVTVTDMDGGYLPGVVVVAQNPVLTRERTVVTDAEGRARLLDLPPGNYQVTAQMEGFKTQKQQTVVYLGQTDQLTFVLQIAAIEEV